MHKHQLFKITLVGLSVLILHDLLTITGFYDAFWWTDIPMHFFGGIAIGSAAYFVIQHFAHRGLVQIKSKLIWILIIIAITALAAVSWEFFEYFIDLFGKLGQQMTLDDTLKDICMGILGGTLTAIVTAKKTK